MKSEERLDSGYLVIARNRSNKQMGFPRCVSGRGYKAVGGEYLVILVAYVAAWKAINYLFDSLEELESERNRRKKRSRRTARMRDYR